VAGDEKPDVQTQAAQAAEEILRRIATLELAPGETFTERDLAGRLGMGKVPVREGLLRLSWTGLLQPRTGSGYTVTPITLRGVRDLFDALKLVESASLELALQRGRAQRLAEELRTALANEADPAATEFQIHTGIALSAGNLYLSRTHPGVELYRLVTFTAQHGTVVCCRPEDHQAVVDAMASGDDEGPSIAAGVLESLASRMLEALTSSEALQLVNIAQV
jgi:DNA-binding GntR family transcriptional regulator